MNLHLAVGDTKQFFKSFKECNVENILISYAYFKDVEKYIKVSQGFLPKRIILDSGAFSVWTKGDIIDIDKYITFCMKMREFFPKEIEVYNVNLDVLPGRFRQMPTAKEREQSAIEGWKNMEYMNQAGLKVIHVFHQHEDFKWLNKLIEKDDYIGISPANDASMKLKTQWLDKVFSIVKNTRKCHGFAVTSLQHLLRYPFYSVDSSSWVVGGKFGVITTFEGGKMQKTSFRDKTEFIKMMGNTENKSTELLDDYLLRNIEVIKTYQKMEKYVNEVWNKRGIIIGDN